MEFDLRPIVQEIASLADEFLDAKGDRAQARVDIFEMLTLDYSDLTTPERARVTDSVMAVLESDDYFGIEFVGDAFKDDSPPEEE